MTAVADPKAPPAKTPATLPPPPSPDPQGIFALGSLMAQLGQDPKTRRQLLTIIRERVPDVPIPELDVLKDAEARAVEAVKPLEEQNKALDAKVTRLEEHIRRQSFRDQHGLTDEELAEVETLAKEKGITKAETAVEVYQTLGRPRASSGGPVAMTAESRKELYKNPKGWYEKEATRVLTDLRRRRGA